MGIQDIIEGKKQWRAHMARVKALPPDYQIVYKEMQKYLFKVGPIDLPDGRLLPGIVDFFEEGVAAGKGVLELIGNDVAAFCDDLVKDSRTYADVYQESISGKPGTDEKAWTGMVPVDDTALAVTDTGGPGIPVVYLNGQFATQGNWRRVIAELGTGWRHITYDERARGKKSKRSADYSFEAAVRDVDAVLAARGVGRALVVGWSYGAFVAAHWASRNPDRTVGAVLVEGAQPYDWLDEAMEQQIRKLFKRLGWFMPLLRPTGLTPRMNAEQMANSNIEVGKLARERELGPVMDNITVPTRYVVASGASFGSNGDGQERIRASLPAGGRAQPEHQDQREGRQQPRCDPAQGLPRRRRRRTRGGQPRPYGSLRALTPWPWRRRSG